MERVDDRLRDLGPGIPGGFVLAARALPIGLLGQFLLAGQAMFRDGGAWGAHGALGAALVVPVLVVVGGALLVRRLRGLGWWAGTVALLFGLQVTLGAAGTALALSLHPLNGALLLVASLVVLSKVERQRGAAAIGGRP